MSAGSSCLSCKRDLFRFGHWLYKGENLLSEAEREYLRSSYRRSRNEGAFSYYFGFRVGRTIGGP